MDNLIINPHTSEKAKTNIRIFKVLKNANKPEIKKQAENLLGLKVKKINIINVLPKTRQLGKIKGYKKGYKKAIIYLYEQEIKGKKSK